MRKKILLTVVTTLASLSSVSATALTGFYLGGNLGGALLRGTHRYTKVGVGEGNTQLNAFGLTYGIHAGYIMELGNSRNIVGVEAAYLRTTVKPAKNLFVQGGPVDGRFRIQHIGSMIFSVLIGKMLNPKVAIYGKIGYEIGKFQFDYTSLTFGTQPNATYKKTAQTIVPGIGGSYAFSQHFLIGVEYNFAGFFKKIIPRPSNQVINGAQVGYSFKPSEHRLMVKLSYKF
jgi:opacity protein-like surface antigen